MIKLVKGDLLLSQCNLLCHGVNCKGRFAAGLAEKIAQKWPQVKTDYLYHYRRSGWFLGSVQFVYIGSQDRRNKYVVNMATQHDYGRERKLYVSYDAIKKCVENVLKFADRENYSVALPKVGCGLGGGDWTIVEEVIRSLCAKYPSVPVEIYS